MEITGGNPFGKIDGYVRNINKDKSKSTDISDERNSNKTSASGDSVELSQEAKTMGKAMEVLDNLPDIREEKVAEIRERIASGTYQVDGKKIAEKMIKESMLNNLI